MEPGREQNRDNNAGLVLGQSCRGIIHAGRFDINISLVHAVFHTVSTLVQQGTHLFANQGDGFTAGSGVGTVRGRENIQNSHAPIVKNSRGKLPGPHKFMSHKSPRSPTQIE